MIWIRADANNYIGSGHIMRCLSIADALRDLDQEVTFLTADYQAESLLCRFGFPFRVLHTDYRQMEQELPLLSEWIPKGDTLLVDSYYVTHRYLAELKKHTRLIYMDDLCSFPYPVDAVIDYNLFAEDYPYQVQENPDKPRFYLGPQYVPLRREFREAIEARTGECSPSPIQKVLLSTGGGDSYGLAGKIVESLLREETCKNLQIYVICGAFSNQLPKLLELAGHHDNVLVYQNVQNMSELMRQCDVAITAAGSTMYELAGMGLPMLCFSFAENQKPMVEAFRKRGLVPYGGDYLEKQDRLFAELTTELTKLLQDAESFRTYREKLSHLVDGKGAIRIAKEIIG